MNRVEFVCPSCRETILAPVSLAYESAVCPKCGSYVENWPPLFHEPDSVPRTASTSDLPHSSRTGWLVGRVAVLFLVLAFVVLAVSWLATKERSVAAGSSVAHPPSEDTTHRVTITADLISVCNDSIDELAYARAATEKRPLPAREGPIIVLLAQKPSPTKFDVICKFPSPPKGEIFEKLLWIKHRYKVTVRGVPEKDVPEIKLLTLRDCEIVKP